MLFALLFLLKEIIHLSPVQDSNFSVRFFIKFLLSFSLKLISILPLLKLTNFTLRSRSYLSSISFSLFAKFIKSWKLVISIFVF